MVNYNPSGCGLDWENRGVVMQYRNEWGELEHPEKNREFLEKDNVYEAMQFLDEIIKSITSDKHKQLELTMACYVLYNTCCKEWSSYNIRQIARLADEK